MDGEYEKLEAGMCHYCPKGHTHSLMNDSDAELEFFCSCPGAELAFMIDCKGRKGR